MSIGTFIRQQRRAKGMTQSELAAMLETSIPHISNLETGKVTPRLQTIERLASALGCPASAFLDQKLMTSHNSIPSEEAP